MKIDLSPEEWAQVRHKYEQTDKPIEDICAEHGFSSGSLRVRARRWGWRRRWEPIAAEGPPPLQRAEPPVTLAPAMTFAGVAATAEAEAPAESAAALPGLQPPHAASGDEPPPDPAEIVPQLLGAIARILPTAEAAVAKLAAGPMPPREMERAARALTSCTGTLRELTEVLSRHQPQAAGARLCTCDMPEDIDEFRNELARRIDALVASQPDDESRAEPEVTNST